MLKTQRLVALIALATISTAHIVNLLHYLFQRGLRLRVDWAKKIDVCHGAAVAGERWGTSRAAILNHLKLPTP